MELPGASVACARWTGRSLFLVVEQAVVVGPFRVGVGCDTLGIQQVLLPAGAVLPGGAPSCHGKVRPPVRHAEAAQIHVPAAPLPEPPGPAAASVIPDRAYIR
jgi:hypothetical protein